MRLLDFEDGKFKEYRSCWNFDDVGNSWLELDEDWEEPYVEFAPFIEFTEIERALLIKNTFQFKTNFTFNRDRSKWYNGPIIEPVEKLYWIYNSFDDLLAKVMIIQRLKRSKYLINIDQSNNNERFKEEACVVNNFKEIIDLLILENRKIIKQRENETFSFKLILTDGKEIIIGVYQEDSRDFYNKSIFMKIFDMALGLQKNSNSELMLLNLNHVHRLEIMFNYLFSIHPSLNYLLSNEKINCPLIQQVISSFIMDRKGKILVKLDSGLSIPYEKFVTSCLIELIKTGQIEFRFLKYYEKLACTNLKECGNYSIYKTERINQIHNDLERIDQYIKKLRENDHCDEDYIQIFLNKNKNKLIEEISGIQTHLDFP
jgi:hypothetical protein